MDKIYKGTHYKGLPTMHWHPKCKDGFIEEMLETVYKMLHFLLAEDSQLLVVRVDFHFDSDMMHIPKDNKIFQSCMERYTDYLKCHKIYYGYFWTRERDNDNFRHHYHMYWIFKYKQIKQFRYGKAEHDIRLKDYWEHASQFVRRDDKKVPVWFPDSGELRLTKETLPSVFERISYMCKVLSKENDLPHKIKRWSPSGIPKDFIPTYMGSIHQHHFDASIQKIGF